MVFERQDPGSGPTRTAALAMASTGVDSLLIIADELEELAPPGEDVRDPHEQLIKTLRETSDRYADSYRRIESMNGDAYDLVFSAEIGSRTDDIRTLFEDISRSQRYAKAFSANTVCEAVQFYFDGPIR